MPIPPKTSSGAANFILKYVPSMNPNICADVLKLNAIRGKSIFTDISQVGIFSRENFVKLYGGLSIPILEIESAFRAYMDMAEEQDVEELIDDLYTRNAAALWVI